MFIIIGFLFHFFWTIILGVFDTGEFVFFFMSTEMLLLRVFVCACVRMCECDIIIVNLVSFSFHFFFFPVGSIVQVHHIKISVTEFWLVLLYCCSSLGGSFWCQRKRVRKRKRAVIIHAGVFFFCFVLLLFQL